MGDALSSYRVDLGDRCRPEPRTGAGGQFGWGVFLPLAGGTLFGPLMLARDPMLGFEAVPKMYVDRMISQAEGNFVDAPGDGRSYVRRDHSWHETTLTNDVPIDNDWYVRRNRQWVPVSSVIGGDVDGGYY